jgi:CheY-like chemotaxis protein
MAYKILTVDDSKTIRMIVKKALNPIIVSCMKAKTVWKAWLLRPRRCRI